MDPAQMKHSSGQDSHPLFRKTAQREWHIKSPHLIPPRGLMWLLFTLRVDYPLFFSWVEIHGAVSLHEMRPTPLIRRWTWVCHKHAGAVFTTLCGCLCNPVQLIEFKAWRSMFMIMFMRIVSRKSNGELQSRLPSKNLTPVVLLVFCWSMRVWISTVWIYIMYILLLVAFSVITLK